MHYSKLSLIHNEDKRNETEWKDTGTHHFRTFFGAEMTISLANMNENTNTNITISV